VNLDQRSLDLINAWKSGDYKSESQKTASLQLLIIDALKQQQELVQQECCNAVKNCEEVGNENASRVRRLEAMGACLTIEI
jgi:hypothetical protein